MLVQGEGDGIDSAVLAPFLAQLGPVAVVDLETTGLPDAPAAEILEIGIVLLDASARAVASFESLVRPRGPVPRLIQRLTGLRESDFVGAPSIEALAAEVRELLTGRTIVAHNAGFERHFLARYVSPSLADAEYLDSQDLLALTHPDARDMRLETFTRTLLGSEERHRALADALDAARILARVAAGARADELRYRNARRALESHAPDSPWLALLGKPVALSDEAEEDPFQFVRIEPSLEEPVPFDEEAIARVLADTERGARHFKGYRVRPEQIELARHFYRNLADGGVLLLEGGTGVGKSLAYLAAAIPFAAQRAAAGLREPIVISTRTRLLQDQLLEKDIAAAARFLGHAELRALSIKGRANYVCEKRLAGVLAAGRDASLLAEDRLAHAVLMACARTRAHGEVGSLPAALYHRHPALRDAVRRSVAQRAEQCSREECARHRACPFGLRRAALGRAHLLVANHDLLLRWPPDYPRFGHVIADEGHELAGVADEVYARVVRPEEIFERIDDIFGAAPRKPGEREPAVGLLPRKQRLEARREVGDLRRTLLLDLTRIGGSLADAASDYGEVQLPARARQRFPEAAELAEVAAARLEQIVRLAGRLDAEAEGPDGETAASDVASAVDRCADELRGAAECLRLAFSEQADDVVSGFERLGAPHDRWLLSIRPVSPAEDFHAQFLGRLESFAAVSASLFVAGDPFAALGELEIEERSDLTTGRVSLGSPFDYASHMRVVALKEVGDLVTETAAVIALLARELGGRTLGLFTNLRRMNEVAELLAVELAGEDIEILVPRRASEDPAGLVARFRSTPGGAVLLGARTFWQGIDIPGDDLQAVVIEKLPFEVPSELHRRREERLRAAGADPFGRYTLGKMLLHLKQMTGRLIRGESDRGIVVIVEGRSDRRYFPRLRQALPQGSQLRVARRDSLPAILGEVGLGGALTGSDSKS